MTKHWLSLWLCVICFCALTATGQEILTPKPGPQPRINGARVYGQRPGRPFLFTIPATGDDPITYSADNLPPGLSLDAKTGRITGTIATEGDYTVTLTATNSAGKDSKPLLIKIGDAVALTPPMGWNSWNCFGGAVDQEKVEAQAQAMAQKGLIKHGWTYINIDDTWQGERSAADHALQPNEKFPDMPEKALTTMIFTRPWASRPASIPPLGPSPTQATPAALPMIPTANSKKRPAPSK